jgi:hypothetical protein
VAGFALFDGGAFMTYDGDGDVSTGILKRFGITTTFGYAPSDTNYLLYTSIEPRPLPKGTPMLVWSVEGDTLLLVTLDGETYNLAWDPDAPSLRPEVAEPSDWPEPVVNPGFGRMAFTSRRTEKTSLSPHDTAFETCADRSVTRALAALPPAKRDNPGNVRTVAVRRACRKVITAWEKAFADSVTASIEERKALYEAAKARVRSLMPAP